MRLPFALAALTAAFLGSTTVAHAQCTGDLPLVGGTLCGTLGFTNSSSSVPADTVQETGSQWVFQSGTSGESVLWQDSSARALLNLGGSGSDLTARTDVDLADDGASGNPLVWGSGALRNNIAPLHHVASFSGSITGPYEAFGIYFNHTDTGSVGGSGYGSMAGIFEQLALNGSGVVGERLAGEFDLELNAPTTHNSKGRDYTGLRGSCGYNATDLATNGTYSSCFGANVIGAIASGVQADQIIGQEVDAYAPTSGSTATAQDFIGQQIVTNNTGLINPTRTNAALSINGAGQTATSGFQTGILFGGGAGGVAIQTGGTLIGATNQGSTFTVGNGIDWHLGTVTGNWLDFGTAGSWSGAGALSAASLFLSGAASAASITASGAGSFQSVTQQGTGNWVFNTASASDIYLFEDSTGPWLLEMGLDSSVGSTPPSYTIHPQVPLLLGLPSSYTTMPNGQSSAVAANVVLETKNTWTGVPTFTFSWANIFLGDNFGMQYSHQSELTAAAAITPTFTGNYYGIDSEAHLSGDLTASTAADYEIHAGQFQATLNHGMLGTAGQSEGYGFGATFACNVTSTSKYLSMCAGFEDVVDTSDATLANLVGGYIVATGTAVPTNDNDGLVLGASNATPGFQYDLDFGAGTWVGNVPHSPCGTLSGGCTLIHAEAEQSSTTVHDGIDFSAITPVDAYYKDGHTTLTTSGVNSSGYSANGTVGVSCTGAPTSSYAVINGIVTHC
jgi:hypothetical protein